METKIIWDILSNTGTLATIETRVREEVSNRKSEFYEKELQNIDVKIKEKMLDGLKDSVLEERLDRYITEHAAEFKANSIFSNEEKQEFVEAFLQQYLDLLPYRDKVEEVLTYYLEELERIILKNMSAGQTLLYNKVKNVLQKVDKPAENHKQEDVEISEIHLANDMYCRSFSEPLFLHKNDKDTSVCLKNLFVLQKYDIMGRTILEKQDNLKQFLKEFLIEERKQFLFIEGDAGCGKSSLVSYLNYHYENQGETGKEIFDDKRLITVRLRDMPINKIRETGDFVQGILDYLKAKSIRQVEQVYPQAVLLLDGFDELCMVEGMEERAERYIYDLHKFRNYKIIITMRPRYIRIAGLDVSKVHILLKHLDKGQREQWIQKYEGDCGQTVDNEKKDFLNRISEEDAFGICDTPMALYMLVAGRITHEALCNEWALYHQIFYNELSKTEYNQMFPNENNDYEHEIIEHRDVIYQISEEIAYQMFCNGNSKLYLLNDELQDLVGKIGIKKAETKAVVERCYALCGYWKADTEKGIVEFYHNNMRDFFLCESIMRKMNEIYRLWCESKKYRLNDVVEKLCMLFQYGELETMVCKFILLRTMYHKEHSTWDDFYELENRYRKLPELMQYMLVNGEAFHFSVDLNPINTVCNVLSCLIQVYRHIYEPMLEEEEKIKWWNNVEVINYSGALRRIFKHIFIKVPVTLRYDSSITLASKGDFSYIDLHSCDLRNAGFADASLENANLRDTVLQFCDFQETNLYFARLENADFYHTDLQDADMRNCKLGGAEIRESDFTNAKLEGAVLPNHITSIHQGGQLTYIRKYGYIRKWDKNGIG